MEPWKWLVAACCAIVLLLFAASRYSRHVRERLDRDGVEVRAVLTGTVKGVEYIGYKPTAPGYREKRTVYSFRYVFTVDGVEYSGKVPKKSNLSGASTGDSVLVRYLPHKPGTHRLVKDEKGRYKLKRTVGRRRGR